MPKEPRLTKKGMENLRRRKENTAPAKKAAEINFDLWPCKSPCLRATEASWPREKTNLPRAMTRSCSSKEKTTPRSPETSTVSETEKKPRPGRKRKAAGKTNAEAAETIAAVEAMVCARSISWTVVSCRTERSREVEKMLVMRMGKKTMPREREK